jgi:hypothetical protein
MSFPFGGATLLAGLILLLLAVLFYVFMWVWQRRGRLADVQLRPLPSIEALHSSLQRAAEMGETVHLSPGTGTLHERNSAAETIAGLGVVQGAARESLALGVPVQVTTNDALVNMLAEGSLERALDAAGRPPGLEAQSELVTQQNSLAYAAGVVDKLDRPEVQGNVLVGTFGEELLLIGEVGAEKTTFQIAGAARPAAASFLPLVTNDFLLGEEIYAAGAYVEPTPARIASLLAQDGIRWVILLLILVGVILATLGLLDSTLGYLFQMPVP